MAILDGEPTTLVLQNTIERVPITVLDDNGNPTTPTSLTLMVYDEGSNLLFQDNLESGFGNPPALPTHIGTTGTGQYYFPFGDTSFSSANSTATANSEYVFLWQAVASSGAPTVNTVQIAKVVSMQTMRMVPRLRLRVDKAVKLIDENPADPVYVGYTDLMLVEFLEGGLQIINAFPPYPMWQTVDQFPGINNRILIEAAYFDALTSQEIFAIDTDVNFSDQGNTFTIDHQPKLAAALTASWQRLSQIIPLMKMHYLRNGGVRVELGPNARFGALLEASPAGSLYRNLFLGSGGSG